MIDYNIKNELSIKEYIVYLEKIMEEQKEIFENAELVGDLSSMAASFNRINDIEQILLTLKEKLNTKNSKSYTIKFDVEAYEGGLKK